MFGKVTFDEYLNALERYCKGDLSSYLQTLMALFPKSKVLKGLVSRSDMVEAHEMGTSMLFLCPRFSAPSNIVLEYPNLARWI